MAVPAQAERLPAWAKVSKAQVTEAEKLDVPVAFTNSIGVKFVLIPAGTFIMGSRDPASKVARLCGIPQAQLGWFYDEHPCHEVTFTNAFYLSIHEVTHAEYATVIKPRDGKNGNKQLNECPEEFLGANKPVVFVSWADAEQFCTALNRREAKAGCTYTLPTEAQWEYACRAGSTTPFSFGETLSTSQANYNGDYTYSDGKKGKNHDGTVPVGSLSANAWGLYDLHGNVSEWCADWYGQYNSAPAINPQGPDKSDPPNQRVMRGGAWRSYPGACRSACRLRSSFNARLNHIGFRVSCTLPVSPKKIE
jgi:formylglycine-generating enzyme required for sulfatase activity